MNLPTKLIDSHCHLNLDYTPQSLDEIIREAKEAGVEALVTICTEISGISEVQKISETYEQVFHTIGVHPDDSSQLSQGGLEGLKRLEQAAIHPKCRAIGEIGLDYHNLHSSKEIQIQWLEQQLELAKRVELPVIIHSREAEDDLYARLKPYALGLPAGKIPGVIHCFSGTLDFGKKCLDLGFLISFSGIVTFKKAEEVQSAAKLFPLEQILVETDSPFLAPVPFRGKKCTPKMVKQTAQKIAELRGIPLEEVALATTANAKRFFKIFR
jgi:TatD DNase family protein